MTRIVDTQLACLEGSHLQGFSARRGRRAAVRSIAVGLTLAITASAAAPAQPTVEEQRRACTPDALRLCAHEIPNLARIIQCLRDNKPNLSSECRYMFEVAERRQPAARRSLSRDETGGRFWCTVKIPPEAPSDVWSAWCEEAGTPR